MGLILVSTFKILHNKVCYLIYDKGLLMLAVAINKIRYYQDHTVRKQAFGTDLDYRLHWNCFQINILCRDLELIYVETMRTLNIHSRNTKWTDCISSVLQTQTRDEGSLFRALLKYYFLWASAYFLCHLRILKNQYGGHPLITVPTLPLQKYLTLSGQSSHGTDGYKLFILLKAKIVFHLNTCLQYFESQTHINWILMHWHNHI